MNSIRLICMDTYQAAPIPDVDPTFSQFRGNDIKQVPILRVFGITSEGEKVCLHIHGVFPYMYVPYSGQIKADILTYRLAAALDAAINVSLGSAKSNTQHVYKIQEVSGIPYYGYHKKRHHFLKIYFYNPAIMKRATDLLQTGCILEQNFQPHEAHIPFTLQFMIDYNIYGMSMIKLRSVKYRHSLTVSESEEKMSYNSDSIIQFNSNEKEYLPFTVARQSLCKLEMDAWGTDIINREEIDKGIDMNPGIAAIWAEEKARRAQADLRDSQLTYPKSPDRTQGEKIQTDNDIYQQTRLVRRLGILESQGDENASSSSLENLSYPIPVPDNSNLLNASQLEIHAGPFESSIFQKSVNQSVEDVANESKLSLPSQSSYADVSLNSSDLNIAEMLINLAKDQEDVTYSIDSNSILGSQKSQQSCEEFLAEEDKLSNNDDDDDDEEVSDLNLTNIQLDTLNFSSWETNKEQSQQVGAKNANESQIELALESLNEPQVSNLTNNIPQLDGPIDDENARMGPSNEDVDVTIERHEHVICEYKSKRGRSGSASVTSRKRKLSSSDDDNSCDSVKRSKIKDQLPKTPRRSPKPISKLTSPSCPSRTYSPLSVEISSGQKTPKHSPCSSPSSRPFDRKSMIANFRRKRIFSPVKESNEDENREEESKEIVEDKRKEMVEDKQEKIDEEKIKEIKMNIDSSDSNSLKTNSKTSEELFTPLAYIHELDKTLVEDSDDSLETIVPSPPSNPVIINESDSNDTNCSKEKQSILLTYSFPRDNLQTLEEEVEPNEVSFSQFLESKQKTIVNQSCTSFSKEGMDVTVTLRPKFNPPSRNHIIDTLESYDLPKFDNVQPFFSNQDDVKDQPQNIGALVKVRGKGLPSIAPFRTSLENVTGLDDWRKMKVREFHFSGNTINTINLRKELAGQETVVINPLKLPPDRKSIISWLKMLKKQHKEDLENENNKVESQTKESQMSAELSSGTIRDSSLNISKIFKGVSGSDASNHLGISCGQIEFNSRMSLGAPIENLGNAKALTTYQFITIFCLEVHVRTRSDLLPDPRYDAIDAIFYAIHNDVPPDGKTKPMDCGAIIVNSNAELRKANTTYTQQQSLIYVTNEEALFESLLSVVERYDPEFLIGWDLEFLSWGYIFQRASNLGKNLINKMSRIPSSKCKWEDTHEQGTSDLLLETLGEAKIPGRIVLDIWRIMRHEIALTSYTYENVMYHVLNERVPYYSFEILTNWWNTSNLQWRVVDHYTNKVIGIHRMLHHLDIINRTSELARLYGIQFYEVFSRGSQFRVESMMLRIAKPLNYIPVSPSAHQRGCMRAPESLPLIMEPESTMYSDPVVVLDFQSLYPSIIIAYNYCFSTCLGRIEHIGSPHPFEFGATTLKIPKNLAMKLRNKMVFAPCGVAYVKKEVRQGILPRMLTEILDTRLMVKKAINDHPKDDRNLQRALHSRQLGLKLIANVTYGYTAANFSGRMPCIEVGDSVVSKGKETLERAIKIVETTPKWGARVIYGDTDSLFVLLKGKSREEAFNIGAEIADTVTAANPKPVKLKFEKVMQPCILQTKKRYCGYMYENLNDEPVYLAKGIETVRRDGCPAVAKILEKTLRILFDTKDLSLVKQYVIRQLDKVFTGRASIQDLTFAKEFRGIKGYKASACVPALELTRRLIQKDPRAIPRTGARVPYIIVAGGPNETLIRCVRAPMELILDPYLRPNATYYITKVIIPPLNRCLNLIGVDAYAWFIDMPHRQAISRFQAGNVVNNNRKQKTTISQYLCNTTCPACGQTCDKGICKDCIKNQSQTLVVLHEKCRQYERIYSNIKMICESCIGVMDADSCTSLDCPIFYRRIQARRDNTQVTNLYDLIQCMEHLS